MWLRTQLIQFHHKEIYMKYLTSLIILLGLGSIINAQSWVSSSAIIGDNDITIIQSKPSTNGSTVVFGFFTGTMQSEELITLSSNNGSRDYFVARFTRDGVVDWMHNLGSSVTDYLFGGIGADPDGNIYVSGGYKSYIKYSPSDSIISKGNFDTFLAKYDSLGNILYCKNVATSGLNVRPSMLRIDQTGNIILTGFFSDSVYFDSGLTLKSANAYDDYFYGVFDATTGDRIWVKQVQGIDNALSGRIFDATTTADAYYFTGMYAGTVDFGSQSLTSTDGTYDVHVFKTDLSGDIQWIRSIKGTVGENSYAITNDPDGNVFVAGYYDSPASLTVDSTSSETISAAASTGSDDIFIAKYSPDGILQWIRTNGSAGSDKVFDIDYYDNAVHVAGKFTDVMYWGGLELSTTGGLADQDMFYGSLDLDGNYRSARGYAGRNNSVEEAHSIFNGEDGLSTVIASNSDLLVLGSDFYTNPNKKYFVAVGNIGCTGDLALSLVSKTNANCYEACDGTIQLNAANGFGAPYMYSIDNGLTYQTNNALFTGVCEGDYQTLVLDNANCSATGPVVSITQPAKIETGSTAVDSISCYGLTDGIITLSGITGGTGAYAYSVDSGTTWSAAATLAGLMADTFYIAVKDANECVVYGDTVILSEPEQLVLNSVETDSALCNNESNGSITLDVSGGRLPYTVSADGGTSYPYSGMLLENLAGGDHVVYVKDNSGCVLEVGTVTVLEPDVLEILLHSKADITQEANGEIVVTAEGGTRPYTFTIDPVVTGTDSVFSFTAGQGGDYIVSVDDAHGCGPVSLATVTIVDYTGILSQELLESKIYPNPSSEFVTIETSVSGDNARLEMISLSGQVVLMREVHPSNGLLKETLNLSGMTPGSYMVRVNGQTLSSGILIK